MVAPPPMRHPFKPPSHNLDTLFNVLKRNLLHSNIATKQAPSIPFFITAKQELRKPFGFCTLQHVRTDTTICKIVMCKAQYKWPF